jgi:hypothetical protein
MGQPYISSKRPLFLVGERWAQRSTAAVMTNGLDIFRVYGTIKLLDLISECVTANDSTASTLQYQADPDVGASATISGASATLASAAAGAAVILNGDALTTAPAVAAVGIAIGGNHRGIIIPPGIIELVVGTGSTTGTWRHFCRYLPVTDGAKVMPI